ncbi:MAG: cation diffusion facilitator family transporter [Treponema sp.]|nr:cation diffusion facilitator family transporter [Treponema sp.]
MDRNKTIIRTSFFAILTNLFLVAFKATVGILSNSIAVILDAVNNASDALSSLITIVGAKLAAKAPDKKHPQGYGRIEYVSAMIVAAIVMYAGITSAVESVKNIINPGQVDYKPISLIILSVALVVKFLLGLIVRHQGKKVDSSALVASGTDSLFDSILSLSVLVSALIYLATGFSLEAYVGILISCFIIKAGLEMLLDTLNDILGRRADPATIKKIKALVNEEDEVRGTYDVILNDYGPEKTYASFHVEVADNMTAEEIDRLNRKIESKVYCQLGIIVSAVGIYSYNTGDNEAAQVRNKVITKVKSHEWAIQVHGFYIDMEKKTMRFDVVVSFDIKAQEALKILYQDMKELYPDYSFQIAPDLDYSDL